MLHNFLFNSLSRLFIPTALSLGKHIGIRWQCIYNLSCITLPSNLTFYRLSQIKRRFSQSKLIYLLFIHLF